MQIAHPEVRKIISETQNQIRRLTGNDSIYVTLQGHSKKFIEFDKLVEHICFVTGVSFKEAVKANRQTKPRRTRQLIAFYAYDCCSMTLESLGEKLGGQDHTTIIHSIRRIKDLLESSDPEICTYVTRVNMLLSAIPE